MTSYPDSLNKKFLFKGRIDFISKERVDKKKPAPLFAVDCLQGAE